MKKEPKKGFCLKSLFTFLVVVLLAVAVILIFFWQLNKFPEKVNPVTRDYRWQYKSQNYTFKEALYQSVEKYYRKKPKGIYSNFEEMSLSWYLNIPKEDKTISDITQKMRELATDHHLSSDQVADLVVSFVQSLPYDDARAKTDLTHPRYPYETLYEGKGICSDKTLLTVAIFRQLGYGAAVFMYESDQHMTAAIECPRDYSNYNSGYCIAETTATGHKIGIIPELNQDNLQAVQRSEVQSFDSNSTTINRTKKLSNPTIYSKTQGKVYQGVIQTLTNEKEIEKLSQYFEEQKPIIDGKENELASLKNQLDNYKASNNYQAYNNLVPTYNDLVREIKLLIDNYNAKVVQYNTLIKE